MKHCIYCGAEMPDEAKFCGICGKPFSEEQLQQSTEKQQIVASQQIQQQSDTVMIQPQSNSVGTVGFVFAIISFISFVLFIANAYVFVATYIICGIIGYICSLIGLFRKPNGLAIKGGCLLIAEIILSPFYIGDDGLSVSVLILQLMFIIPFVVLIVKQKKAEKSNVNQTKTNKI